MAQRISRAKRTVSQIRLDQPGDLGTVMHTLYLVFNQGYSGDVDLAAEAIRLTRQLSSMADQPEVGGLLALMLLHHARRPARRGPDGRLIPLADQNRQLWDRSLIAVAPVTFPVMNYQISEPLEDQISDSERKPYFRNKSSTL